MAMVLKEKYRRALVSGTSSGLGAAFAEMLLAEGVSVWGTSREASRVPARFHPVALDLADMNSVDSAWQSAESASGGIDLLVNNAGAGAFGAYGDAPISTWEAQVDLLYRGPARLSWLAIRAMIGRGRGCIVNVSSLAVEFPIPFMPGYNAGKAALAALSASLDLEARGMGVTVIDFRPGDFRTGFNRSMVLPADPTRGSTRCSRVWTILEKNIDSAPAVSRAARDLRAALAKERSGVVRSGGFFQARLAPFLARFGSVRTCHYFIGRYFGIR